ncbi:MAG: SpoIVB peptidase [Lachnospiraceae bacterium]|nr:SpoIVB peptidase [Lachnospiraceae bacterium]
MTERKRIYRRWLVGLLTIVILFSLVFTFFYFKGRVPGKIYLLIDEESNISFGFPFTVDLEDNLEAALGGESNIPADKIKLTEGNFAGQNATIQSSETGDFQLRLKLFGLFDIKTIDVEVTDQQYLYPSGRPVGLYLETDGVMVIGTSELNAYSGQTVSPADGLIRSGDYILAVDGTEVDSKEELSELIYNRDGEVVFTIRRNGEISQVAVHSIRCDDGIYRTGIWVRDDVQGIGTLTYVDQEGNFGCLGHGISDTDTGQIVEICEGDLYQANIRDVLRGRIGSPGSLLGMIVYSESGFYGTVTQNTARGVFGKIDVSTMAVCESEAVPVGYRGEIEIGPAQMLCSINGETGYYDIEIIKINLGSQDNKSMTIEVTDQRLLEKTGGILQGMSGSAILQNGKIIGAVTHVLVNDPTKGYGIFIENMLDEAG